LKAKSLLTRLRDKKEKMFMKKTIILLFLLILTVPAQRRMDRMPPFPPELIYSDIVYIPSDSGIAVYLTYRIPYNRLLFEKEGENFLAQYRFVLEIFRDSTQFVKREIKESKVISETFDKTDSENTYEEGFIKLSLNVGEYKLIPLFTDLKTNREMRLKTGTIKVNNKSKYYQPIVTTKDTSCSNFITRLANYEGYIPFDNNDYEILVPLRNAADKYFIELTNKGKKVFEKEVTPETQNNFDLQLCGDKIFLKPIEQGGGISYLSISPGPKLTEGDLDLSILNEKGEKIHSYKMRVKWFNKPRTLMNPEIALNLLRYLDDEDGYKTVLKGGKEDFDSLFYNFWKKYDPTPSTAYNELMNEYYSRADYAARNFTAISGKTGFESDRGMVYIKFGKPARVDRTSNEDGKVIEIWFYTNEKRFSFIDEKGTGEFILMNS